MYIPGGRPRLGHSLSHRELPDAFRVVSRGLPPRRLLL